LSKKDPAFDFEKALKQLQAGKPLTGKGGIFTPLIKELTEAALKDEIEAHLAEETDPNRRNGYSKKIMKSSAGAFELNTPRDRNGNFALQMESTSLEKVSIFKVSRHVDLCFFVTVNKTFVTS
jgi:transposase-like protein